MQAKEEKFSEMNKQHMDAEFEWKMRVQNSQSHPPFGFE
jgi:hypothetical protein